MAGGHPMMTSAGRARAVMRLRGGGTGASTMGPLPDQVDKATAQAYAGDQFDEAAFDTAAKEGSVSKEELLKAAAAKASAAPWRRELIESIFHACDDDKSGALSYTEFGQMFDGVDGTVAHVAGSILFGQADTAADGKLNVDEFVAFYLAKFATLDDNQCREVCGKLLDHAKQRVSVDKSAAVVENYTSETKSSAVAAPLASGVSTLLFVSYATWPPDAPRFVSYAAKKETVATATTAPATEVAWRRELLESLFKACDTDGSGALSHTEFVKMFDGIDDTTRHMAGAILFGQADTDADGKLKVDEFVAFYIAKLASTGDDQCREMCGKLIDAAKQPRV